LPDAPFQVTLLAMENDATDETLMLRYRDGDNHAFERLYARHKGTLYRYLLRQCGNPSVTEELFQDVWLKIIKARTGYTVQAKFTTWLFQVAHNRLIDHYRTTARRVLTAFEDCATLESIPNGHHVQPEQQEDRRRQVQRLLELIAELPEPQREAFLLREEAGLSLEAIAEATGVSRETAKSRLRYALAKLRQGLGLTS
jgi:RNA polymerase sigma-70 factor (ECF subfamily)